MTGNKLKIFPMLESNDRITFFACIVTPEYVSELKTPDESYQICSSINLDFVMYNVMRYADFHGIPEQEVMLELIRLADTTFLDHEFLHDVVTDYQDIWGDRKEWRRNQ